MSDLDAGSYGIVASSSELRLNYLYRSIVNCSSPSMGSGIVESKFVITEQKTLGESPIISEACVFGDIGCEFRKIPGYVEDAIMGILNTIWDLIMVKTGIYPNYLKPILDIALPLIKIIFDVLVWFINIGIECAKNPVLWWKTKGIPFILTIWLSVLTANIIIVMTLEVLFIGITMFKPHKNIVEFLLNFVNVHFQFLKVIYMLLYSVLLLLKFIWELLLKTYQTLVHGLPFT
jgi:hypothetical protein